MASKKNLHPDLSGIETAQLEERLRTGQLTTSDVEHLLKILALFATLRQLLHKRSLGLLTLLRRMFGVKSAPFKASDNDSSKEKSDKFEGHGRRGRDGYPRCGADLEIISAVLDTEQISRYLKYVGMPAAPPPRAGIKMKVLCDDWC